MKRPLTIKRRGGATGQQRTRIGATPSGGDLMLTGFHADQRRPRAQGLRLPREHLMATVAP